MPGSQGGSRPSKRHRRWIESLTTKTQHASGKGKGAKGKGNGKGNIHEGLGRNLGRSGARRFGKHATGGCSTPCWFKIISRMTREGEKRSNKHSTNKRRHGFHTHAKLLRSCDGKTYTDQNMGDDVGAVVHNNWNARFAEAVFSCEVGQLTSEYCTTNISPIGRMSCVRPGEMNGSEKMLTTQTNSCPTVFSSVEENEIITDVLRNFCTSVGQER